MDLTSRIYIPGHTGMVGGAVFRTLRARGYKNLLTAPHGAPDLRNQAATAAFIEANRPDAILMCAALVGGIEANRTRMADFAMDNMQMGCNVLAAAHEYNIGKVLYVGSSCIYPREGAQPLREEALFGGPFEPTNEGYALAKSFGVRMCGYYRAQYGHNFVSCIPANAYGPGDRFDGAGGHVVAALMERFHKAKLSGEPAVTVWGTGKPRREFIYIEDLADALCFLLENCGGEALNIGTGEDASIAGLAGMLREVVGYGGALLFDDTKPDGMPRRMLDSSKIQALGWRAQTPLREGLEKTYQWYLKNIA